MMRALGILLLSFLCTVGSAWANTLEAKKKTNVLADSKRGSEVLLSLDKGDTISSLGRKGMFWKVKVKDKIGFVSVMAVKRKVAGNNELADVIRSVARDSRDQGENASIRSRSAVMGVRGLDESDQIASVGNMKPDLRAVYRMEDRNFTTGKTLQKYEARVSNEIERILEKKYGH